MDLENRSTIHQNMSEVTASQPKSSQFASDWHIQTHTQPQSHHNPYQYYSHHPWCPMVYYQSQYYPTNTIGSLEQKPMSLVNNSYDSYYKMMPSMPAMHSMPPMIPYYGQIAPQIYDTSMGMYSMPNYAQSKTSPNMKTSRAQSKPQQQSNASNSTPERKTEKKYWCKLCNGLECDVETNDEKLMRSHVDIHLGSGPPFVCAVCSKHFPFRSTLRNHLIAHMVVRYTN